EDEAVLLANFCRYIRLDRLGRAARENVEVGHQLFDELIRFQTKLGGQFLDDDRRLDVNDLLWLDLWLRGWRGDSGLGGSNRRLRLKRRRRRRNRSRSDCGCRANARNRWQELRFFWRAISLRPF